MELPVIISDFFKMKNEGKDGELWSLFTTDAIVIDSGEKLEAQGTEAIKQWVEKSISGLRLQSEIQDYGEENGEWIINTIMSGDFKGSPALFKFYITIAVGKIYRLNVQFLGSTSIRET